MIDGLNILWELGKWGAAALACGMLTNLVLKGRHDNEVWRSLGIQNAQGKRPYLLSKSHTPDSVTYTYYIPDGVDMAKLLPARSEGSKAGKLHNVVKQAFAGQQQCDILPMGINKLAIKVYEQRLKDRYVFDPAGISGDLLRIPIGQSLRGVEHLHLGDSCAHVGIAGTTGSGKSTAVRIIVTWLAMHPEPCELHLVDLKGGVELGIFADSRKVNGFARSEAEARGMISALVAEMGRRYKLLAAAGVANIRDYPGIMRRIVLIIDEFADLSGNKECMEYLVDIARKGRAAGVHMVLATQRPDAQTIDGRLKANVVTWLCFKVKLPVNSIVILGHGGAEALRGAGHGILDRGDREVEIQGYIMSDEQVKRLIAPTIVRRPAPQPADTSGVLEL